MNLGSGITEEIQGLIGEAEALAAGIGGDAVVSDHEAFLVELQTLASPRRRW